MRPLRWKTGVTTEKSFSCPDVFQGSLVIRTSPGESSATGKAARKCFIDVASEFMWPGVPVTACASIRPLASKTAAERSPDSRTTEVNEVLISAAACSLATPINRFQRISRLIGSICSSIDFNPDIAMPVDRAAPADADDRRRLRLLQDGRTQ